MSYQKIYFRYPYDAPLENVEIRRPQFGNSHKMNFQMETRHSRNGTLFSYSREPTYEQVKIDFNDICRCNFDKKWELKAFFDICKGDMFLYADHEGYYWRAVVIKNPFDFVHSNRERFVNFTMHLEIWDKVEYDLDIPDDTILDNVDYIIDRASGDYVLDVNGNYITTRP